MVNNPEASVPEKIHVIIVAAGTGNRFGGNLPKQFAILAGKPVLMHSIEAFSSLGYNSDIVLVLSESEIERWRRLCSKFGFESPRIVCGGDTRTASVRNALAALDIAGDSDIVMIHDGARPLVDRQTIDAVLSRLHEPDVMAAIPSTPITDSLMTAVAENSSAVDRSSLVAVQTPQGFKASVLVKAYACMSAEAAMTDDASAVSRYAGASIHLVEGSRTNIKITYPSDIRIAEVFLAENDKY